MIDILKQGIFMMNCKALFFLLLSAFPVVQIKLFQKFLIFHRLTFR